MIRTNLLLDITLIIGVLCSGGFALAESEQTPMSDASVDLNRADGPRFRYRLGGPGLEVADEQSGQAVGWVGLPGAQRELFAGALSSMLPVY